LDVRKRQWWQSLSETFFKTIFDVPNVNFLYGVRDLLYRSLICQLLSVGFRKVNPFLKLRSRALNLFGLCNHLSERQPQGIGDGFGYVLAFLSAVL
jgi:hypothetical protein